MDPILDPIAIEEWAQNVGIWGVMNSRWGWPIAEIIHFFGLSLLFVGMGPLESLVFAVGIIVANVPEGLLPTVTLSLAMATQRMATCASYTQRRQDRSGVVAHGQ